MHIKKLDISGFKSFVDRTSIHFDNDVIGIVGPNGCGKSNVVDAIRWCMGEQSAKHLRGRSMEDVIFNGSDSRAPAGLAEVTLTFDNTDPNYAQTLPLEYRDFAEIAVTRRLFRDGTSEYKINKTQVRLRDITELFLGTGVGTKAYSIVEQGRIGQIVSARPEDRRLFIEEAAGVTKYKQRRKQAERKMELTRQNLARIHDIVSEIERTSASLQRQVAKAERYKACKHEYEDLVLHDSAHKLLEFAALGKVQRQAHDQSSALLAELEQDLQSADLALSEARAAAAEVERQTEGASKAAFSADNEVSSLQAENQRCRDRVTHLEEKLQAADGGAQEAAGQLLELEKERAELEARLSSLSSDEDARKQDASSEDEALVELKGQESEAALVVEASKKQLSEARAQLASLEAKLEGLENRKRDAELRCEGISSEQETITLELETLSGKQTALRAALSDAETGKQLTEEERAALESQINDLRADKLGSEQLFDQLKNDLGLKRNRLRVLSDLHRRLEGVGAGARSLLNQGDDAVLGMVADRIEAPEELTAAFAGLLGERLQYVVVKDPEKGLSLLEGLRGKGRGHVVPLRPAYVAGARSTVQGPGVLGRLADQLSFSADEAGLVQALVGDAVLTETAQDALRCCRAGSGITAVALDGTVARPDGVISGGSGDDVAAAMVEQKREMNSLGEEIAQLEKRFAEHSELHQKLCHRQSELETSLERAKQQAHEGALAHVGVQKDLSQTVADIERAQKRQLAISHELQELRATLSSSGESETECSKQRDEVRLSIEQLGAQVEQQTSQADSWRQRVASQAALVTERKVRLAQVKEQTEAARSSLSRLVAQQQELTERKVRLALEADDTAHQVGATAAEIMLCREKRIAAAESSRLSHQQLEQARARLEQIRADLSQSEGKMREHRVRQAELDNTKRGAEMELQRLELGREHLLSSVREKFRGLELARVVGDYHLRPAPDQAQQKRMAELSRQIDRMGPVNLEAEREYDEAQARYHSLHDQKMDIEKALIELEKAIRHMDKESRTRFRDTFDAVNELFKKSFSKNFRGGRGELRLTNPDDLLTSGVDILAQPPGKKLGNIELMSGGEKALTAVSLIFAIFQHRPSPFCVLDEVDAPLDEANVSRYNEAIRSMTANSQFILITHIRKTMQSVDVLYGVTMGEPGVSRLVSVKVNDEAKNRSESVPEHRLGQKSAAGESPELSAAG